VSKNSGGGGGLSTGGAVGLTIGLVVLIATIALMAWYYMRKRKQEKQDAFANLSRANSVTGQLGSAGGGVPSRTMSENSRYVLNTNGRQVVEAWEPETGGRQNRLVPVDPRLDPFAPLYQRDNKSRDSINTLRDDQDYSRRVQQPRPVLRVNNPDTE
jgi:cell wall integrity and stress response component